MGKGGAIRQPTDGDRIQRPGRACRIGSFYRRQHGFGTRGIKGADIDQQSVCQTAELCRFGRLHHHRRGSTERQQHVSRQLLHHFVGQAVNQWGLAFKLG
ncbi:hypothetical protein D3C78_1391440 [compost metagenome]